MAAEVTTTKVTAAEMAAEVTAAEVLRGPPPVHGRLSLAATTVPLAVVATTRLALRAAMPLGLPSVVVQGPLAPQTDHPLVGDTQTKVVGLPGHGRLALEMLRVTFTETGAVQVLAATEVATAAAATTAAAPVGRPPAASAPARPPNAAHVDTKARRRLSGRRPPAPVRPLGTGLTGRRHLVASGRTRTASGPEVPATSGPVAVPPRHHAPRAGLPGLRPAGETGAVEAGPDVLGLTDSRRPPH